jgi:hypothetical protein
MFVQFGAIGIFGDAPVRRWLAGQDEIAPAGPDRLGDRLTGEQFVTRLAIPTASPLEPWPALPRKTGRA